MDGTCTCQALLVAKQGSGNVVNVRDGPWLKNLSEVDALSLYIIVHRNRLCWEYCAARTLNLRVLCKLLGGLST